MGSIYQLSTATALITSAKLAVGEKRRDEVFVSAMPLRAVAGPPQMLMSAAYSLNFWDLQHYLVILRLGLISPQAHPQEVFVYDFQPKDPDNIYTAVTALSLNPVPGVVLKRKLDRLPKTNCWFVGYCEEDSLDLAEKFSDQWRTDLVIGENDCRHYTNGLIECLTGKTDFLQSFRYNKDGWHKNI